VPRGRDEAGQQLARLAARRRVRERKNRQPFLAGQRLLRVGQGVPAAGLAGRLHERRLAAVGQHAAQQHAAPVAAGGGARGQAGQFADEVRSGHVEALVHGLEQLERHGRRWQRRQHLALEAQQRALTHQRLGGGGLGCGQRGGRRGRGELLPGLRFGDEFGQGLRRIGQHGQQAVHEVVAVEAQQCWRSIDRRGDESLAAHPPQNV
jgi:hypothetical protein